MKFTRITVNPRQMGGVPCIHGLRIPVVTVVDIVADGIPEAEILRMFSDLEHEDIREALQWLCNMQQKPCESENCHW